jgi:hypothetical protein
MILKKFLISILLVLLTFSVHADEIKNNNLNTKLSVYSGVFDLFPSSLKSNTPE